MKKFTGILMIATFCLFFALGTACAKSQEICPVMGGAINKEVYADYNGKRAYFCCAGCIEPFNKDPETFVKKMETDGVELDKTPAPAEKTGHAGHKH
jgi:YHS domain-containing protein